MANISGIITEVGRIITALFGANGWVSSVISAITDAPLLMLGVLISFSGLAVGMVKRLVNIK